MATSDELHNELDDLVRRYITQVWIENGAVEDGDAIGSWALIINFGNYNRGSMSGYTGTWYPKNMPPHAIKGLFGEGVEHVLDIQARANQEDDDD